MESSTRWQVALCLLSSLSLSTAYYYGPIAVQSSPYSYNQPWSNYNTKQQVNTVPTDSLQMDDKMAPVPLLLVQSNRIKLVQGGAIYYQPTYYGIRELPAIRLELQRPMTVSQPKTMIEFPASFTYFHDGNRVPFTIAAVLAPVYTLRGPHDVHVVFAVPAIGLPSYHLQPVHRPAQPTSVSSYYPSYQSAYLPPSNNLYNPPATGQRPTNTFTSSGGIYSPSNSYAPSNTYSPTNTFKPSTTNTNRPMNHYKPPANHYVPPSSSGYRPPVKPSSPLNHYNPPLNSFTPISNNPGNYQTSNNLNQVSNQGHNRPLVTILDFPSSVSSPSALFFQPPLDPETGLGNREPPQAVVPAGIVQSTAPLPNLSVFVNSKESTILQGLRDEAEKHRLTPNSYTIDYDVIIN